MRGTLIQACRGSLYASTSTMSSLSPQKAAAGPNRDAFPFHLDVPTRWGDNDVYGHVNNVRARNRASFLVVSQTCVI